MKIIDIHAHTGKWLFHSAMTDEKILGMLERFSIVKAVFSSGLAIMYDLTEGNRQNYDFILKDERCYGYVVVNQNHPDLSVNELKKYLGREKIIGVKMHPTQFDHKVNTKESRELLRIVDSYGLPVLIHTEDSETARPKHILDIAVDFPNNKYIIAHMGNAWWKEALETASRADNIYTDIVSSWCAFDNIRYACEKLGDSRVLYGSDLTLLNPALSIGNVMSSEISDRSKEKIFYENAAELFEF
jgi:uncharacterized protein